MAHQDQEENLIGFQQEVNLNQLRQTRQQEIEFDDAISYVTTVKERFENEPLVYRQFLQILYSFDKQQGGLLEIVVERILSLFFDHPDLLEGFTHFLPEGRIEEYARERLHYAAAVAKARNAATSNSSGTAAAA
mmetsp:Transcript_19308/g.27162  ORF Transcript_19308/g.27162 Transcript_19308/m.27162 type:complete len:134 (-) Transcript_19308:395-796(-)|eukprot:CAMPEP_0184855854 /NCGR_PEP_ID=MMETSP0580-20130426/996_1 /TAXON_ID=1118495 /ORGANISM="Dactyliosolen fragilissimus" /LENGTH=133 /DNA_ID=CAMNT_0027350497 /DNA_START=73 /DNA_END=474 /DNA_ORIENTATION=-